MATAFAIAALVGSIVLLQHSTRFYAIVAIVVSGLEVALAFGVVSLHIKGLSLVLVLGAVLAVVGVLMYLKASAKTQIAAATVVTLVGVLQVLQELKVL